MRNVLLIAVDTLRADHLGCYGYARPTSPRLDALAAEGAVLDAFWSASNFTAPAFTSLFTASYPQQHGVLEFHQRVRTSPVKSLLDAAGYHTGGVVTFRFFKSLLRDIWGPSELVTETRSFDFAKELPRAVSAGASEWLREHGRGPRPWCLFVHYDGPHAPYRLPAEFADRFDSVPAERVDNEVRRIMFPQDLERLDPGQAVTDDTITDLIMRVNRGRRSLDADTLQWLRDKYDASIRYNDQAIAELLDTLAELDLAGDTVVGVMSDHGEEFLEHGQFTHGQITLNEEIIRTVGIVREPEGVLAGRRIAAPLSHVGLWPTLLELAGLPLPQRLARHSFRAALRGGAPPTQAVHCQGKFKTAVRQGDLKLIRPVPFPGLSRLARLKLVARMIQLGQYREELYDLAADPQERTNLAGDRRRREPLRRLIRELHATPPQSAAEIDADEKARIEQELKDLGYM